MKHAMQRRGSRGGALMLVLGCIAAGAVAAQSSTATPAASPAAAAAARTNAAATAAPATKAPATKASAKKPATPEFKLVVEPRAMELLKAMSAKLAAARTMSFTATVGYEYPSKLGPPIVYTTRYDVTMQRPDKLRILTPGDGPASEFYYDGKAMVAYAPAENLAAVADAPPTIDAALQAAYRNAGIFYPFTDLLVADPYAPLAADAKLAFTIGPSGGRRRRPRPTCWSGRTTTCSCRYGSAPRTSCRDGSGPSTAPIRCACGTRWSCRTGSSTRRSPRMRSPDEGADRRADGLRRAGATAQGEAALGRQGDEG